MTTTTVPSIHLGDLPPDALLQAYQQRGAYTDCYVMDVPGRVLQADYIAAFYTSRLFKVERRLLALLAAKPASDDTARQLALGEVTVFSAWTVESRTADQLLLCDFLGRTRSWLMSVPGGGQGAATTRLYFGSAVVPKRAPASGPPSFGFWFHALTGFHKAYTRLLMRSMHVQLVKRIGA